MSVKLVIAVDNVSVVFNITAGVVPLRDVDRDEPADCPQFPFQVANPGLSCIVADCEQRNRIEQVFKLVWLVFTEQIFF